MTPELTVVLSVFNRPVDVLRKSLASVLHAGRGINLGFVIVDDGSDERHRALYAPLQRELGQLRPLTWIEMSTIEDRPETYHIGGHNNPAYCTNRAIDAAVRMGAPRTLLLSSDVRVSENALECALQHLPETVVIGRTTDSHSGTLFCGSELIWPMCWFVACDTHLIAATRFDERYCDGMAFEDNDFMGRLFLLSGRLVIDDRIACLHQSHPQTAYSDDYYGFKLSEEYTRKKWGGVPFRPQDTSLTFQLERIGGGSVLTVPVAKELAQ